MSQEPWIDPFYEGVIYRPPSEASSLILQVTVGCRHNQCTFCSMYKKKSFRIKSREEIRRLIEMGQAQHPFAERIFLADGDALKGFELSVSQQSCLKLSSPQGSSSSGERSIAQNFSPGHTSNPGRPSQAGSMAGTLMSHSPSQQRGT